MAHLSKRVSFEDQTTEYGIWIVVTIIAAIIIISGVVAALVILVLKYRQQQSYSQVHYDSQPSSAKLPKTTHSMPINNVLESGNEDQRNYIIRKSLAGRMASTEPHVEPATHLYNEDRSGRNSDQGEYICQIEKTGSLLKDWKQFEAGLRRDKSRSPTRHPSVMMLRHPPSAQRASDPFIQDSTRLNSTEEVVEEEEETTDVSKGCNTGPQMQVGWGGQR
ncbi:hypothetical protein MGU_02771 [Metarhizium guizhouense ARSEF 977]|uniref:Uncharacterized protein n=1 Tax=Metarhizium guizhouense (strain ARSEF 977) TaxID=1276136 RepID=A0A0B4HJK2_METGA|nr:hypothetical protein MGU_02771 [Metarhizium guizhouense ARSEF 977]